VKIQKFNGKTETEVMNRIKEELGDHAVVLNVKNIKGNWFTRLFKNDQVEITVATDKEIPTDSVDIKETDQGIDELKEQMLNMERLLASTADKMENLYEKSNEAQTVNYISASNMEKDSESKRTTFQKLILNHLVKQEVEEEAAMELLKGTELLDEDDLDIKDIIRIVYNNICQSIGDVKVIDDCVNKEGPKLVFFIGPTGVGKTTSIAKLTADFSLKKEKDIALITADTYRIAAIDQLRTYSEILSVPLEVVYTPEELRAGLELFDDKEYIFVDTAGRSHKNDEHLGELRDMLDMFPDKEVYLVVSATTKFSDLKSIIKKYSQLCDKYSIIVTKTDETASAGTIINLRHYTNKPLSYVSFGQNVPDDIEVVEGAKYAKILLGSLGDE